MSNYDIGSYNENEIRYNIQDNINTKYDNYNIEQILKEYSNIANYRDKYAQKASKNFLKKIKISPGMFMWIEGRNNMQNNDYIYKTITENRNNKYYLSPDQKMELTNIYLRNKAIFEEKGIHSPDLDEGWRGGGKRRKKTRQKKRKTNKTRRRTKQTKRRRK